MSKQTLSTAVAIAYLLAGIFTYAHVYQRIDSPAKPVLMSESEYRAIPAFGAGAIWPIYWTCHWAFKLTKPEVRP